MSFALREDKLAAREAAMDDWGVPQIGPKQPSAGSKTSQQNVPARDDEWWDAIDSDEKYQRELENFDKDGHKG